MVYIKNIIYKYRRKQAIKIITRDLGRIEETDDTIYCYVDEKKFKSECDYQRVYGFNLTHPLVTVQGNTYSLYKNIVYIFDGIFFERPLSFYISSKSHNHIKFQNCTFTQYVSIGQAENVEFINNRSNSYKMSFYTRGTNSVKNIKFINDHTLSGFADSTFINLDCETLEMNDTVFRCDGPSIKTKKLIMNNSHIYSGETITINAKTITLTNSDIYSSMEIKLNAENCNGFPNIKAYNITYNGLNLSKYNNSFEYIDDLQEERKKLVDTLATIKTVEEQYQKDEVNKYRKELKNSPLVRRLERK